MSSLIALLINTYYVLIKKDERLEPIVGLASLLLANTIDAIILIYVLEFLKG